MQDVSKIKLGFSLINNGSYPQLLDMPNWSKDVFPADLLIRHQPLLGQAVLLKV